MKLQHLTFAGLGVIAVTTSAMTIGVARADLSWEHSGQVRVSRVKQPVLKFKLFTNMTPSRHRLMFSYYINPSAMANMGGGMNNSLGMNMFSAPLGITRLPLTQFIQEGEGASQPAEEMPNFLQGSVGLVQRFDDGQIIGYASLPKQYVSEPIKEALAKSRFDPWKKLAPKLSQNEPPSFTHEQRMRLGAEVRAVLAPYTGRVWKTYFRELPEKRMINGIEGHGYRLTTLLNMDNPFSGSGRWMRVAMEWWIAGTLPGDEIVSQLREIGLKTVGADYKSSTSIWLNELPRNYWAMLPEEFHRAAYTLVPPPDATPDSPAFKRANMPLAMYMTVSPPAGMVDKFGDIRAEMNLVRRSTDELPARVFEAPAGYKRVPLDDIIKQMEKASTGARPPMPGM